MKRLFFTVTNDLSYDQRMQRICTSLAAAGYDVTLVGRVLPGSLPLTERPYREKRLKCFFNKGFLFYGEYNLRLFFFLLLQRMDLACAIDLDTILPCLFISKLKKVKRVYDAHEYFTELKEVHTRPGVQKIWMAIERFAVRRFDNGYTVSEGLSKAFQQNHRRNYEVIRNLPVLDPGYLPSASKEKILLYQGAVNEGRGFEYLIPALKSIPYPLVICGDGNFMSKLKVLIKENKVEDRVQLKGMMLPAALRQTARSATMGIGLADKEGINQFMALPNKYLEYMHAGLPQIAMAYPEYEKINVEFRIAVLLDHLEPSSVAKAVNELMEDEEALNEMSRNALEARKKYCWQEEEKKLLEFYQRIFES